MAADMTTYEMLDDINLTIEERRAANAFAIAGYVNGSFDNWPAIVAKWSKSGKFLLSIDVQANPAVGAQCLDIEKGDATIGQAVAWFKATQAAGKATMDLRWYPKLYVSAGSSASLIATMTNAGIARNEYMLWSAHYTDKAHICGPKTCGYPQADATQWTSTFGGADLDASLCYGYFFSGPGAPVPSPVKDPKVNWSEWPSTITLDEGSSGNAVRVLQTACRDSGIDGVRGVAVDGSFGNQTFTAVRNFQAHERLPVDGVAGPKTRASLEALHDVAKSAPEAKPPAPSPSAPGQPTPEPPVIAPVEVPVIAQEPSEPPPPSPVQVTVPVAPEPIPEPSPEAVQVEPAEAPVEPSAVPAPVDHPVPVVVVPEPSQTPPAPAPDILVYVKETLGADLAKKVGLPEGTILFIPHMVQGV